MRGAAQSGCSWHQTQVRPCPPSPPCTKSTSLHQHHPPCINSAPSGLRSAALHALHAHLSLSPRATTTAQPGSPPEEQGQARDTVLQACLRAWGCSALDVFGEVLAEVEAVAARQVGGGRGPCMRERQLVAAHWPWLRGRCLGGGGMGSACPSAACLVRLAGTRCKWWRIGRTCAEVARLMVARLQTGAGVRPLVCARRTLRTLRSRPSWMLLPTWCWPWLALARAWVVQALRRRHTRPQATQPRPPGSQARAARAARTRRPSTCACCARVRRCWRTGFWVTRAQRRAHLRRSPRCARCSVRCQARGSTCCSQRAQTVGCGWRHQSCHGPHASSSR